MKSSALCSTDVPPAALTADRNVWPLCLIWPKGNQNHCCHSRSPPALSFTTWLPKKKEKSPVALTKRQLEASVQQEAMGSRVLGAVDLVCLHQDLRIQKDPLARTLLEVQTRPRAFRDVPPQLLRISLTRISLTSSYDLFCCDYLNTLNKRTAPEPGPGKVQKSNTL